MKVLKGLAILTLSFRNFAQAQNSTKVLQAAIQTLPKCALDCFITAVAHSDCTLSDFYCIARNKELNHELSACVESTCTIREALTAKNFSQTAYGAPIRDHTKLVSYTGMIPGGIAILAVILRVVARVPCFGGTWGPDDWAIIVAMLPVIPLTGLSVVLAHDGLGEDIWRVPFDNITHILHIYYFDELFYLSSIALTKISILLFYLRIFPNPRFRRYVHVTILCCALYILGFIPATIFQCAPIRIAWQRWDGPHGGACIDLNAEIWASAAFNIVFDLVVIFLPLRELSKLAMGRRQKAGIMLMFLGGGFVTIISALRLKYLIQFAHSSNVTWDYTPIGYWSTLEVHVGIIVACLPALRSLQHRIYPDTPGAASYYDSRSGYGISSGKRGRGSPFPSLGSLGKMKRGGGSGADLESGVSLQVLRRERGKDHGQFVQLSEYPDLAAYSGGGDIVIEESPYAGGNGNGREAGTNNTHITRGSMRRPSDDATFVDLSSLAGPPEFTTPASPEPLMISVRKEYSVDVEEYGTAAFPLPPLHAGTPQGRAREVYGSPTRNFSLRG